MADDDFDKEIDKVLKEHMPSRMYEVLKEKISERDSLEKEIEKLDKDVKRMEKTNAELEDTLKEHSKLDERFEELAKRESEIEEAAQQLANDQLGAANEMLQHQLMCSEDKVMYTKGLLDALVRNTSYRRKVFDEAVHYERENTDEWGNRQPSGFKKESVFQQTEESAE